MAEEEAEVVEAEASETPEAVEPEASETPAAPAAPDAAEQLRQELAQEREARIRLEERVAAQPAAKPAEPAKEFTRVQLREAVNAGQISEDQMEEIWANQQRELTTRDVKKIVETQAREHSTASRVDSEMQKYIDANPELTRQGSDAWNRVKREYDFLTSLGDPANKTTELKALRAAFGTPDRIAERTAQRRTTVPETSSPASGGGERPVDVFNRIPTKYRDTYRQWYKDGIKTLDDIQKELPYMRGAAQ